MKQRKNRILQLCFIVLGSFVGLKMLLFGLPLDEEYQITMSYRLAMGDGLFNRSWDTIQTSGFLNFILIKVYLLFGTTDGIVLYLRACGLIIQLITSLAIYKRIKRAIPEWEAFLIAFLSFVAFAKMFPTPDFSTMLMWFMALMLCTLWDGYDYYCAKEQLNYPKLIVSALLFSATVLCQACFILVPIVVVLLCVLFPGHKWKSNLCFFGTCGITALVYVAGIILRNGLSNVLLGIRGVTSGDITHASGANILGQSKYLAYLKNGLSLLGLLSITAAIAFGLSLVLSRTIKKYERIHIFAILWFAISGMHTLYCWFIQRTGYDGIKLYIPCTLIIIFIYWCKYKGATKDSICPIPFFGILLGAGCFINVLFVSNVPLTNNLPFLLPSVVWGMVLFALLTKEISFPREMLFSGIAVLTALGTMFTLQSGPAGFTIFDCNDRITEGPAKGVMVAESVAKVYNSESVSFSKNVSEGSTALLVTNGYFNTLLYYCYLENGVNISHYSVNSTPTFIQMLEGYWVIYPDKFPDVIVVNNSTSYMYYGWIFDYIENYYGYTKTLETEYATYYYK